MNLLEVAALLLALAAALPAAQAQGTTCTFNLNGLSLAATRGRAASSSRQCSIDCTGATLKLTVAPALQPYVDTFTGVTATVNAAATALVTIPGGSVTIGGSSFTDCDGGSGGSVLAITGGSVSLEESLFGGCSAAGNASAVVAVSGARLSISGSAFEQNSGEYQGGAVSATDSVLTISGTSFVNNTAGVLGGAISHQGAQSARLAITSSTFTGNSAGCKGGAIYANQVASVTVDGTTFRDGSTEQSAGLGVCAQYTVVGGAGVFQERIPTTSYTNSRFTDGTSAGDAGAMAQNSGQTSVVQNCTFTGNQAVSGFVAALEQNAIANTRVLGCTFTKNQGSNNGALLHQGCDTVLIEDSTFVSNTALVASASTSNAGSGGGGGGATLQLSCAKGCSVLGCNFTGNAAPQANGGGLLANSPNNLEVSGNTFQGNTAGNSGGGLAVIGSGDATGNAATVFGNTFIGNKVTDASGAGGGAMLYQLHSATASDNEYTRNTATSFGGGLYVLGLSSSLATITDSTFEENQSQASGGGMSVFATQKTTTRNCTFVRNSALSSGALDYDQPTEFVLDESVFRGNTAQQTGGAVGAASFEDANFTALAFSSNVVSGGSGGAIYASSFTSVLLGGCNFTSNQAALGNAAGGAQGGAVVLTTADQAQLDSCDFRNNSAGQSGGALAVLGLTNALVTNTGFELNSAEGSGGALFGSNLNYSMIIVDSGFDRNRAQLNGGAVDLEEVLNVQINGTVFTNNTATNSGGAVSSTNGGANLQFFDSQFGNNSAVVSGGALSAVGTCGTALATSQFAQNVAGTGGAVYIGDYGRLGSCTKGSCRCPPESRQSPAFDTVELDANNATTGGGGAIAVDGATDRFNMTGCIFNANAAATAGGAVALTDFAANATTTITKADFEGNIAQQQGGALALVTSPGVQLELVTGTFTSNAAALGGGLYADNKTEIVATAVEFNSNQGAQGGGGVQCDGCTAFNSTRGGFSSNNASAGGGGGLACAGCSSVLLQSTTFLRNAAGFGAGAYLAGGSASRTSVMKSTFIENKAAGGVGEGGGGGLQSGDGLLVVAMTTFRRNSAAGNGGGLLLSSTCNSTAAASCAFASIAGSTFNANAAMGAGGAMSSDSGTLPVALNCTSPKTTTAPSFALAAQQQKAFTTPSFPADCNTSFVGNTAGAYGDNLATGPSSLQVSPSYIARQRSNQRLPVTVNIVDDLGQQISGTGVGTDLVISVVSMNASLVASGQTRVAAFNGSAQFTGLTVRAPTESTPYDLAFVPSSNALAAASADGASAADVAAANLDVVIQPCIVGEVTELDICVECSVGTYSFDSGVPCQSCPEGAACYGGATLVPEAGYWHSAANSTEIQVCPRRSACNYDGRTQNLTTCQTNWYAEDADTSLTYDQLTIRQAALPCTLWGNNTNLYSTYQQQLCAPGYTGPLCGACTRDADGQRYGFYSAFTCTVCKSDGLLVFLTILGFLLQFGFILFTIFSNMSTNQQRFAEHEAQPSDFIKVLIIYLQYNFIASKLPLNWPRALINFVGGIQIFFSSSDGIFSLDCLLQKNGSHVPLAIQRQIFSVVVPLVLLFLCAIFWVIWWYVVQPYQKRRRMSSTEERILAHAVAAGIDLPPIKEADEEMGSDSESIETPDESPDLSPQTSVGKPGGHLSHHSSGASSGEAHIKGAGDSLESRASSKKNLTLDQLFRAIELEKLKSMDESRSPIERTQSMRKALSVELAIELERESFAQYAQRISIVSVLVVCFFVYPTVCQAVLNTFACYHIDDGSGLYADNQLARWGAGYWQQNMEQRCYTGSHLTAVYAIGIPGIVLLCLGIPAATLIVLLRIRDRLQEPRTAATYGFLYHQFKEGFFWWSVVDQLRLLILVIIVVFGRSLAPFVQLHIFIFVLLVSAAVSVALQPHAYAGTMDLISMSSIAFLMFMSLYFIGYDKQPSGPLTTTVGAVCLVFDILVIIFMLLFTVTKTRKHFVGYWRTFLKYLGMARTGSVSVVRRAQQRRLLWQAKSIRRRQQAAARQQQLPVSSSAKAVDL